jgi:hypothetical protein
VSGPRGPPHLARIRRWLDAGLDQIVLIPFDRNYYEILETVALGKRH